MDPSAISFVARPFVERIQASVIRNMWGWIVFAAGCLPVYFLSQQMGGQLARFGVPLIDLGTIRLPRIIGHGRAMDLVLTGRPVQADEALAIGLVNRVVEDGRALDAALEIAGQLAAFPQAGMRGDRLSLIEQWGLEESIAARNEVERGLKAIAEGGMFAGAQRFAGGEGRKGKF